MNRYARRTLEKLPAVFANEFSLFADSAGYLVTQDGRRWVEEEPLLFRQADAAAYLAFRSNEQGDITHLFHSIDLGGVVPGAYEKLKWHQTRRFVNEFYLSWVPFLLITWIGWPLAALLGWGWRRWKDRPRPPRTLAMHAARWTAALFGAGTAWFAFGFIQPFFQAAQRGGGDWLFGMPPAQSALLWIPLLQIVLFVALVVFAVQAWRHGYWHLIWRLHYTVFVLAATAWILFVVQYNLVGWLV